MQHRPKKLLDHVRDAIRLKHYSIRTEESYITWITRYSFVSDHLGYRATRRDACPVRCQQGWEARMEQVPHRAPPRRRL